MSLPPFLSQWRQWTLLHTVFFLTFLVSGLCINLVQAVLYLCLCKVDRNLFRRINYYLLYLIHAQLLFVIDWWSGSKLRLYAGPQFKSSCGKQHALALMNHHYDIDWLFGWMMMDRFSLLGNSRTIMKRMLSYVPLLGWAWNFSDFIYVRRDWTEDQATINAGLEALADYPDPCVLVIYAEGTRVNAEKLLASQEFARERGLTPLKHHLVPRTKGFVHTLRNMNRDKMQYLYDGTLVVNEKDGGPATFADILTGRPTVGEAYMRIIPIKDIPTDEEGAAKFLIKLYEEKDTLKDNFLTTGSFTRHGEDKRFEDYPCHEMPPRPYSLIIIILLQFLIGWPLLRYALSIVFYGSWLQALSVFSFFLVTWLAMHKMMNVSRISKASGYGAAAKKSN